MIVALFHTALSFAKILIKSRPLPRTNPTLSFDSVTIIGNGPTATAFLDKCLVTKPNTDLFCVNKFAVGKYFHPLQPKFYLLHDADFFLFSQDIFDRPEQHPRCKIKPEFAEWQSQINSTWREIYKQDWGLILFIPRTYINSIPVKKAQQQGVIIQPYNYTVTRGYNWFKNLAFGHNMGMPQCQNVINAAIFQAINLPCSTVYTCGLDHDFHMNLSVGEDNVVFETVSHFYTHKAFKHPLVHADGSGKVHLREIFLNLHKLHCSYHELQRYAVEKKKCIKNITPGGFMDEFDRENENTIFN